MERRDYQRLPAETEVEIKPVDAENGEQAASRDLSGGGILLITQTPFPIGSLLDIEVRSTVHQNFAHVFPPLRARIRVVRSKGTQAPYEIAAEFVEKN